MDIPDDADGRVAIFTVEEAEEAAVPAAPVTSAGGAARSAMTRLGTWLDAPYAGVAIAALLALLLVVGLLLLRR